MKVKKRNCLSFAGASEDSICESDILHADGFVMYITNNYSQSTIQTPRFGLQWFNNNGMGDYLGRVDTISRPTVWRYNQVNDSTGMGAVATWCGVPVRMAKVSNFMVGYATTRLAYGTCREYAAFMG